MSRLGWIARCSDLNYRSVYDILEDLYSATHLSVNICVVYLLVTYQYIVVIDR